MCCDLLRLGKLRLQMIHSLLSLYQSILVPIFSQWISDEDLCCVDTAVCNHKLRNFVLLTMQKCAVSGPVYCNDIIDTSKLKIHERFEWLLLRGMSVSEIGLSWVQPELMLLHQDSFNRLESISTRWSADLYDKLENAKLTAKHLKLTDCDKAWRSWGSSSRLNLSNCCTMAKTAFAEASRAGFKSLSLTIDFDAGTRLVWPPTVEVYIDEQNRPVVKRLELHPVSWNEIQALIPYMSQLSCCIFANSSEHSIDWCILLVWCRNLTSLSLELVYVTNACIITIMLNCPMLKSLFHWGSPRPVWMLNGLAPHCQNIESFEVDLEWYSECDVLSFLRACPKLTQLSVGLDFTSVTLNLLVSGYEALSLRECYASIQLRNKSRLKAISVSTRTEFTLYQYAALFSHNPRLLRIELQSHKNVNDDTIKALVKLCPLLTSIGVQYCHNLTRKSLVFIAECEHLTSLSYCTHGRLHNADLESFLRKRSNLTKLSLSYYCCISGAVLTPMARYCHNMKYVDVSYNEKIQTSDVIVLLKGCTHLNFLNLRGCSKVGIEIFAHIKSEQMRYLNVRGCNIPSDFVQDYKSATGFQWLV